MRGAVSPSGKTTVLEKFKSQWTNAIETGNSVTVLQEARMFNDCGIRFVESRESSILHEKAAELKLSAKDVSFALQYT